MTGMIQGKWCREPRAARTVWVVQVVEVNVKGWCPVGVISVQGHHQQRGPGASQLVMTRLQTHRHTSSMNVRERCTLGQGLADNMLCV